MYRLTLTLLLLLVSLPNVAHDGHDHSLPMAGLIHLLWIAPMLIAAIFLSKKLMKTQVKNLNK